MTRPPGPTLLTIPYELRSQIYGYMTTFPPDFNPYNASPPIHPLLLASRQLYKEFISFYYGTNIFHLQIHPFPSSSHASTADRNVPAPTRATVSKPEQQETRYCISPWQIRPRPILHALREVMLHVDSALLQNLHPTFPTFSPRLSGLAAAISLAPNIEVLHIHTLCATPPLETPSTSVATSSISANLISFITETCARSILPCLLLLVVHIERHNHSDRGFGGLLEGIAGIKFLEWTRGYPRSLVTEGELGSKKEKWSNSCEHAFKIKDRRRLGRTSTRVHASKDRSSAKTKHWKEGKDKFRRVSVDKGINAMGRVIEVVQGVKELELEAMDTRFEGGTGSPCSDPSVTHMMLVHG